VTPDGRRGIVMEAQDHKAIRGHRTVIVPGPVDELANVRRIFKMFVVEGLRAAAIADMLNDEGVVAEAGTAWTTRKVVRVLGNEGHVGVVVSQRTRSRFKERHRLPPDAWVRIANALPPTIAPSLFAAAQANLRKYKRRVDDATLVAELQAVLAREGRLTRQLIQEDAATHAVEAYQRRFGSLMAAYARAGYTPTAQQRRDAVMAAPARRRATGKNVSDETLIEELRDLLRRRGRLTVALIAESPTCHSAEIYRQRLGGIRRAYALCGYQPSAAQEVALTLQGGFAIERAAAERLRTALSVP
jgi:hypothetical protein